jgi:DNA-binding NarL/FixJ family response regulator
MVSNGVTRVVIADDHPVMCVGLATLIAAHGWEVYATAADGEEAVARAIELGPDIVVNYELEPFPSSFVFQKLDRRA